MKWQNVTERAKQPKAGENCKLASSMDTAVRKSELGLAYIQRHGHGHFSTVHINGYLNRQNEDLSNTVAPADIPTGGGMGT